MSVSAYLLIILCLLYGIFYTSSTLEEKSVGPVAVCNGGLVPASDVVKNCYHRCLMEPEPSDHASLELYRVKGQVSGPKVIECSKIIQKQTFTLTWTWSYIKSPVSHDIVKVTKEECDEAIRLNCPDGECNHREADNLEEEYHYASDTLKTATTISLLSMPSSVQIDRYNVLISPLSAKKYYNIDDRMAKEDNKMYSWNSDAGIVGCPYEPVNTYGCDMYQDSDKRRYYMCSGGRFVVTASDLDESDIASKCTGIKRSIEGFLYKKVSREADKHEHSRLAITATSNMGADIDYLRHKVQQVVTHLDSEICQNQCELLAIEARTSTRESSIVRVGLNYYKLYSNNTVIPCLTLHGCKMSKPRSFCGNPPRIGVTCTENNGLWDPMSIELVRGGVCTKPDETEKLIISLGSDHYVVDDSLKIRINNSRHHGIYMTSFSDYHQSEMQWKISDIDQLKPEWDSQKRGNSGLSKSKDSNTTLHTPSFSIGRSVINAWSSVKSEVSSVEHFIGAACISILCLLAVYMFYKIKLATTKPMYVSPTEQSPSTGSWI
ncbi:TPA_asm: G [Medicago alphacytorhabdovirus 1]|nr:TPA_asm: G [Medicago alphacytorhabdovirus 1]